MKKQLIKSIGKKALTFCAIFLLIFGTYAKGFSAPAGPENSEKSSYIKYQGPKDNYLVFKVDYANELAQPFQLVIQNDHNEVLYTKAFDSRPLNTNVLLTEIPDDSKLTFSIVSKASNYRQSFA